MPCFEDLLKSYKRGSQTVGMESISPSYNCDTLQKVFDPDPPFESGEIKGIFSYVLPKLGIHLC